MINVLYDVSNTRYAKLSRVTNYSTLFLANCVYFHATK